ncbi:MAG: hypothetical protein WBN45_15675, partial [Arenicellales bacterium]
IWSATMRAVNQGDPGPMESSLVTSISEVFDAHTNRLSAILDKLPRVVMWMLLFISATSLGVAGFNAGIQGRMSRWRMTAFSIVLSGLMIVILDFDRPGDGLIVIKTHSIDFAIASMEAELKQGSK